MTPTMNEAPRKFSPEELDRIRDGGDIIQDVVKHLRRAVRFIADYPTKENPI